MANNIGVATLFKLQIPSANLKKRYVDKFLPSLRQRILQGIEEKDKSGNVVAVYKLSDPAKEILMPGYITGTPRDTILKKLLSFEPEALKKLNDVLDAKLQYIPNTVERPPKKVLLKIFGYVQTFNNSKANAYWLSKEICSNTCVYCNRQYAFTVEDGDGGNNDKRIARPEFDHWFNKSDFPLMSLSLCNLIPSCSICNSTVKGNVQFNLSTHIHPYVHEPSHPDITFKASLTTTIPLHWILAIDTPPNSKEEKTVVDMKLREIYSMHNNLEFKDIMNFRYAYSSGYLKDLFEKVLKDSKRKLNQSEVYRMLFGVEMNHHHFLDRPFSKMKHDLLHQKINGESLL